MKNKGTIVGRINPMVLSFTAGKDVELDRSLVIVDCIGTMAHVKMLASINLPKKLFSQDDVKKVNNELVKIINLAKVGKFKITKNDQDVHLAVERNLTASLGDLGKKVHTCRSRNDQVALDLRLYSKERILNIIDACSDLAASLIEFAEKYLMVPMVGRTHMQPAMPSSVGVWVTAYAESLLEDIELLKSAYYINDKSPLGSAAGYGVPIKIDRKMVSDLLGFKTPVHNVMHAINARGKCESIILSALSQIMLTLSRLAQDIILYSMPEFSYFSLPKEYCTGSSIMPQKSNPDVFELIRAKASVVKGYEEYTFNIIKSGLGGYNRDIQETKYPLMEGFSVTEQSLIVTKLLIDGMTINKEALIRGFNKNVFATDKVLEKVLEGYTFRDSYNNVKENLDKLEEMNPEEITKQKKHLGAPAGLNIKMYKKNVQKNIKFVLSEKTSLYDKISSLMGMKIDNITGC